jgi:prepilin-type N-terminal cleavage/methylation domain-containing protein
MCRPPRDGSTARRVAPGFTLVELLVVIGIIAALMAMLLPALNRARYQANEVVCLSNVRQMTLAQLAYAAANKGKFPPHRAPGPVYVRADPWNASPRLLRQSPWWCLDKFYLADPRITICPFYAGAGDGASSDPYWREPSNPDYGAWASDAPASNTVYCFFANWVPSGSSPEGTTNPEGFITFQNGEKPWPRDATEAGAERVVMAHNLSFHQNLGGGWDVGHGSKQGAWNAVIPTTSKQIFTRSAPVGYGDGHVEVHPRDSLKRRASYFESFYGETSFWY